MTIDKVRKLYGAQPFQPFVIHLADGRKIPVMHPEFMSTAPSGRTIVVHTLDDDFHIIDLALATDLEVKRGGPRRHSRKNHRSKS
jgi:hypothetical protein